MSMPESAIQIEQRIPRCARCGKMINLRGEYLEGPSAGGRDRVLLCSQLCLDELTELAAQAGTVNGTNGAAPEEAQ